MLTLVVSLGVVLWLYSSVMQLGQGLRRRDLHKLIYHLPYKDKLGFPSTPSVDKNEERISRSSHVPKSSRADERHSKRNSYRREEEHSYRVSTALESSSSSSAGSHPAPPPAPAMGMPPYPPRPQAMPEGPGVYVRVASPRKSVKKKRGPAQKKQQSNMGSLSYTRRPTKSTLLSGAETSHSYGPPRPPPPAAAPGARQTGYERGEPSSSGARPYSGPPPPMPANMGPRYPAGSRPVVFDAGSPEEHSSEDEKSRGYY